MTVRARAYAKINLLLEVGPRRPDGYHELLSLMQSVGLHDTLDLAFAPAGAPSIRFRCTHPDVPHDDRNLVYRAVKAFRGEFGVADPLSITLDKGIPLAAGLAGGSADAAATLLALAQLYGRPGADGPLLTLAAKLGADVSFCLTGGTAQAEGIGERLTPVSVRPGIWLVLWKPPGGVSTAEVYRCLDETRPVEPEWTERRAAEERLEAAVEALAAGDLAALGQALHNDLAAVTERLRPEVREARERFLAAGAPGALMSGSGPTVFALAGSEEAAGRLATAVKELPGETYLTRTVGRGIQLDVGVRRVQKETRTPGPK
ncbi:MAG: 4-(cytidine 5'-diphospho)-2-C-methyl-D-erythritol kinase [Betaproteobacteria bacterium]